MTKKQLNHLIELLGMSKRHIKLKFEILHRLRTKLNDLKNLKI